MTLCDHWFNPIDESVGMRSPVTFDIPAEKSGTMSGEGSKPNGTAAKTKSAFYATRKFWLLFLSNIFRNTAFPICIFRVWRKKRISSASVSAFSKKNDFVPAG